ncbi:hypothetical protein HPP92_020519 [Vanilla planifolia]|uniref:Uncharacterized protein n=1 Tax=Vanilla planifolia TaxID=51239 RepID=A0A835Q1F3_VANPL|nr:hypothetical protein HPP92_020519 [Vanilla planifolia]
MREPYPSMSWRSPYRTVEAKLSGTLPAQGDIEVSPPSSQRVGTRRAKSGREVFPKAIAGGFTESATEPELAHLRGRWHDERAPRIRTPIEKEEMRR